MTLPPALSVTTVPLHQRHHQLARQFAQAQPSPEKATQVYRNTLAVLALKDCLTWVDIPTDFAGSDSANPVLQLLADVADLKLPGLGRLDCRPIEAGVSQYHHPSPSHEDCVGLVLVELTKPYQTANILGFIPQIVADPIACADLQPLEDLFLHLEGLQIQAVTAPVSPRQRLSQWLANRGDDLVAGTTGAWQTLSSLIDPQPQWVPGWYGMRSSPSVQSSQLEQLVEQLYAEQGISPPSDTSSLAAALAHLVQTSPDPENRWKAAELLWSIAPEQLGVRRILDLGLLLANQPLSLMVAILPPVEHTQEFAILVRVAPLPGRGPGQGNTPPLAYLPPGLSLAILPAKGELGLQAQARARDNVIQIKLQARLGETFSIQLRCEENVITEYFEV